MKVADAVFTSGTWRGQRKSFARSHLKSEAPKAANRVVTYNLHSYERAPRILHAASVASRRAACRAYRAAASAAARLRLSRVFDRRRHQRPDRPQQGIRFL